MDRVHVPTAAGRLPGGLVPDMVHLVIRMPDAEHWSTACPADVAGLPPGGGRRQPVITLDRVECAPCREAEPVGVSLIDSRNGGLRRRRAQDATVTLAFFRWAATDPDVDLVAAEYGGDSRLHALPGHVVEGLIERWAGRPLE